MSNSGKKPTADDEVEQLLQAAQDDMLLKLTINSHIAGASDINPDLDRRFLALKKPQSPTNSTRRSPPSKIENKVDGKAEDDDDDLCARFAALKNSLPSQSGKETKSDESEEDDDEVEKVIKWAIDAARLDPSPPSDDDDDSQDEDDDHHEVNQGKKKGKKGK